MRAIVREEVHKTVQKISAESDERIERYIGVLKEDFDDKLVVVLEYVKDIPQIKEKQDMMFDKMGEMVTDNEVGKEVLKDHEERLQRLEA